MLEIRPPRQQSVIAAHRSVPRQADRRAQRAAEHRPAPQARGREHPSVPGLADRRA